MSRNYDPRTPEQVAAHLARFRDPPVSTPDVEPNPKPIPKKKNAREKVCPRFSINVHSKRRRRADPDGISAKAAIDGLVAGGLLSDDSAAEIAEVTFSQEISEIEETIIEVWEITEGRE